MPVPAIQPLPSICVHASMDTRSCGSSAAVFCAEVVGGPCDHLRLEPSPARTVEWGSIRLNTTSPVLAVCGKNEQISAAVNGGQSREPKPVPP